MNAAAHRPLLSRPAASQPLKVAPVHHAARSVAAVDAADVGSFVRQDEWTFEAEQTVALRSGTSARALDRLLGDAARDDADAAITRVEKAAATEVVATSQVSRLHGAAGTGSRRSVPPVVAALVRAAMGPDPDQGSWDDRSTSGASTPHFWSVGVSAPRRRAVVRSPGGGHSSTSGSRRSHG